MMARKQIPPRVITDVLVKSRRRCCVCYGLNRDTDLKSGQIAHLDQDASNPSEENLAFLCLEHHDIFDGTTRQSKNLTVHEVKKYRDELHRALRAAFATPVSFGKTTAQKEAMLGGHYIRVSGYSAEIRVTPILLGTERYHVSGMALWGEEREYGPNVGELDFVEEIEGDTLEFTRPNGTKTYRVVLQFSDDGKLNVTEENSLGLHGINVSFAGIYERAPE